MMLCTILVAAAAVASVGFSRGHAEGAQASWCAVINVGRGSAYWAGNIGFCNPSPYYVLDPRTKGRPGNVALARTNWSTFNVGAPSMFSSGQYQVEVCPNAPA